MSNNVAEYQGIIAVMQFLISRGISRGVIFGDSKLVFKQLNGRWRAKGGLYVQSYRRAMALRRLLPEIKIRWVPRQQNTEADYLARKAVHPGRPSKEKEQLVKLIKQQRLDDQETKRRTL